MCEAEALTNATLLNSAFGGLEGDYFITGDEERAEAAVAALCEWVDERVGKARRT